MHNYIIDALDIVSAWDIPDEDFGQALNDQARSLSGITPDEPWDGHADTL